MAFLSRMTRLFKPSHHPGNAARSTPTAPGVNGSASYTYDAPTPPPAADHDTASPIDADAPVDHDAFDTDDHTESPAITVRRASVAARPRNKHELFEELQANYREVVELVRKVDAHLDRQDERADRLAAIADRFDAALPSLETSARDTLTKLDELNRSIVQTLRDTQRTGDERAAALRASVDAVGAAIERSGVEQLKLVSTMAAFRETVTDLARAHEASGSAMASAADRVAARDAELSGRLATLHRWFIAALVGLGIVTAGVVTLTIVTLAR